MKMKKMASLLLGVVMLTSLVGVGCSQKTTTTSGAAAKKEYKIGITFSDLSNPVWAELVKEAQVYGKEKGIKVTYVDAHNKPDQQISQIENFVQGGMDAIIVCAVESAAIKDATKKAQDAGVKIIGYTQKLDNFDSEYILNAHDTGEVCGKVAAKWINDHFAHDKVVEWGLMDLPRFPEIIDRANGIKDAIAKDAPNAKLVATASALTSEDGLKNAENFLQANPNMKVIACIGGGGGVGGNEGVKSMGKNTADFGLFAIDATEQEIKNIMNGDPERASVSLGGGKAHGRKLIDISLSVLNKEKFEKENYMPATAIDSTTAKAYYDQIYAK